MDEIIPRLPGQNLLLETKVEAEKKVNKKIRYLQIIEILNDSSKPLSAKEIAVEMKKRGYSQTDERNLSAPRITELLQNGWLDCVGSKKCQYTNTMVGVFAVRNIKE